VDLAAYCYFSVFIFSTYGIGLDLFFRVKFDRKLVKIKSKLKKKSLDNYKTHKG
jgi:hypothetical protein